MTAPRVLTARECDEYAERWEGRAWGAIQHPSPPRVSVDAEELQGILATLRAYGAVVEAVRESMPVLRGLVVASGVESKDASPDKPGAVEVRKLDAVLAAIPEDKP